MRKYFLVALLMSFSNPVSAGYVSGNDLKSYLHDKGTGGFMSGVYGGYVLGVYDTLEGLAVCAPSNVTRGQITDIVENYINANPEILHKSGSIVIFQALKQTFPCKKDE